MFYFVNRNRIKKTIGLSLLIAFSLSFICAGFIQGGLAYASEIEQPLDVGKTSQSKGNKRIPSNTVYFTINQGQTDNKVGFYADIPVGKLFISKQGELVYSLAKKLEGLESKDKPTASGWVLKETFVGSTITPIGSYPIDAEVSYFVGNDPAQWKKGIRCEFRRSFSRDSG